MAAQCNSREHLSRRALLKGALATAGGGTLMNWGGLFRSPALANEVRQRRKSCILLFMNGGASQFETFDMKVGRATGGPMRPIGTNLPGVQVSELLPHMARRMDKLCVIRSMHTSQIDHPQGIHLMHTGYAQEANLQFPEIGAIAAKYLGTEDSSLPNFIKIGTVGNTGAGFLGPKFQPFNLGHDGNLPPFARANMPTDRELRRHALRELVEDRYAAEHRADVLRMHREAYEGARRLQSALDVFKIDQEWPKYADRYGDSFFGRNCLLARQLVEAGAPFVEVGHSGYDTHADNFTGHKGLLPPMDQAWGALLDDLKERGLLDSTLVVWMGEIGRTPEINNRAGRDHYVKAWTTALSGCGVQAPLIYGETDADGRDVKDNPVTEGDFFATVYRALGIDPAAENLAGTRPIPLAPFGSKVVQSLLV